MDKPTMTVIGLTLTAAEELCDWLERQKTYQKVRVSVDRGLFVVKAERIQPMVRYDLT